MKRQLLLGFPAAVLAAACAQMPSTDEGDYAARMNTLGERYVACITREAENAKNPAGAEDIAISAHAQCWPTWDAYRAATNASFVHGAGTRAELQLARDKADAHLRQFELEARRMVMDHMVERNLRGAKPGP